MALGYLAAGVCWESLQLAGQASCGAFPVLGTNSSSLVYKTCTASGASGALTLRGYTCTATSCVADAAAVTFTPSYASCERDITRSAFDLSFADGSLIGVTILAVWGAAWSWRALRRTVSDTSSSDDT